jgi:protein required for attachment to host cells
MTTSWIVVAHRAGARLFEHRGPGKPLVAIESVDHPQGRFQDRDVGTDRPGRSGESYSTSRHAMEPHETAHEHDAHVFAKTIAKRLARGRMEHAFGRLLLVAEPHFLGYLERELDKPTAALVTDRIHKDLANVADAQIASHLEGALPVG